MSKYRIPTTAAAIHLAASLLVALLVTGSAFLTAIPAQAQADKPNILVIFGDDIGQANISRYTHGVVGYMTPNIDSIGEQGMTFTDYYAENSCTAGRSSFITGQSPIRTGLTKVGAPGAPVGLQKRDITIAEALKPLGYATGQFGKNHLGDRDEYLPTNHVRGIIHSYAGGKIEDLGPLDMKRMETIDDETTGRAIGFMGEQVKAGKPFFVWMNTTRMHIFTHIRPEYHGISGMPGNDYADGMVEHDQDVGKLLKALDDLGVTKNTIVIYTTDNGPNMFSWPDAAMTPFRSEKDSNWEGAFRVPAVVRWPGHIKPGVWSNEIVSGLDWFPTLLAAAGDPTIKEQLLKGEGPGGAAHKVHLDGYNILPYLEGQQPHSPRKDFFYFDDDGQLVAMRHENFKYVFCEQRAPGNLNIWEEPFVCLRLPKIYNLRMDPYERADITSDQYNDWMVKNVYLNVQGTILGEQFIETFKDYPPSQAPASFTVNPDAILEMLKRQQSATGKD
jgi:arylsulfatase A-like enzyme